MITKQIQLNKEVTFSDSFSRAIEIFEERREKSNSIPNWLKLPLHNIASFFLTPIILGTKILYHLLQSCINAAALPISCIATILTLGLSKKVRSALRTTFFKIFEELGEAVLSSFELIIAETAFLSGFFIHPKIPTLLTKRDS